MAEETKRPLTFVPAADAAPTRDAPFVVIVRTREEFLRWLTESATGLEWLQVEGLLDDPEVWAAAAEGTSDVSLDVVLADPAREFSSLYRLASVRIVRGVRVTIPASPGFMKALRLAASLGVPVRLLPGQPSPEILAELTDAADFYLHDPVVEAPIEFFHSLLAEFHGGEKATLWQILEDDPAIFAKANLPHDFVETHLRSLIERGEECASCRWQRRCAGYFKWPDPSYRCAGVQQLLARFETAAEEIERDLAELECTNP